MGKICLQQEDEVDARNVEGHTRYLRWCILGASAE
jgi:hypothetical protein